MLTRKDYEAIAYIIYTNRVGHAGDNGAADQEENSNYTKMYPRLVIRELADYMAADNPRVDREKFIAACYGGTHDV